jgi:hypothetical protein
MNHIRRLINSNDVKAWRVIIFSIMIRYLVKFKIYSTISQRGQLMNIHHELDEFTGKKNI